MSKAWAAGIHPGKWNDFRVVANGNHLQHFINEAMTAEVIDEQTRQSRHQWRHCPADPSRARHDGAVQEHQGSQAEVRAPSFNVAELVAEGQFPCDYDGNGRPS